MLRLRDLVNWLAAVAVAVTVGAGLESAAAGPTELVADQTDSVYDTRDAAVALAGQTGLDPRRIATLRGEVMTRAGGPLQDVKVTIRRHSELGSATSSADGSFELPVNGGGTLTVRYEKPGFLPAERRLRTRWRHDAVLPDVTLVELDSEFADIELSTPGGGSIQVLRGSTVTDEDGTRRATILFPADVRAELRLPDGSTSPLPRARVRATEYTVGRNGPNAMPAELPATSAYTYAVEFSVDQAIDVGATGVEFSKPVVSYTENFLGFDVGELVPVGFYDHERSTWLAAGRAQTVGSDRGTARVGTEDDPTWPNIDGGSGRVVKILGIEDGLAVLDVDGEGVAASAERLTDLGVAEDELAQLARLYSVGQTLWRVPIAHFSPYDYNWPVEPPADAVRPALPPLPDRPERACESAGSIIGCEDQTLGEALGIPGTPLTLGYQSGRMPGYAANRSVDFPVSGDRVPASLKRIDIELQVAGRRLKDSLDPSPSRTYSFTWDGEDSAGRVARGTSPLTIRIGYVYDGTSQRTTRFGDTNADGTVTRNPSRNEVTLWQEQTTSLTNEGSRGHSVGGWEFDVHHAYDSDRRMLYLGDGRRRSADALRPIITAAAGTGEAGFSGDGGAAPEATIHTPLDVAVGPDGSAYFADYRNIRIRRIAPNGIITTVAGDGTCGIEGDGGPAADAQLCGADSLDFGPDGTLYLLDGAQNCGQLLPEPDARCRRVRRISRRGGDQHYRLRP